MNGDEWDQGERVVGFGGCRRSTGGCCCVALTMNAGAWWLIRNSLSRCFGMRRCGEYETSSVVLVPSPNRKKITYTAIVETFFIPSCIYIKKLAGGVQEAS